MNLDALKAAVQGAPQFTAPAASPNSTGANAFTQAAIQHIQGLASLGTQAQASNVASNALYGGVKQQASVDAANENAAHDQAVADAKQKLEDLQQKASDLADPSKYQRVVNNSGGYDFYAPDGTKISAQDYAGIKGQHVTDAVKGSQNTTDQQFLQDYKEVTALGQATQSGKLADYLKKNPDIKQQLNSAGLKTYADVVKNFRSSYPQYFPQSSVNDIGSATYNKTPIQQGGGSFIDKIKSIFGN